MEFSNIQLIIKQEIFISGIFVSILVLFFGLVLNCWPIIWNCYKTDDVKKEWSFRKYEIFWFILCGNIFVVGGIIGIILTIVLTP